MDIVSQRRGKKAAILGLVFQAALTAAMLVTWLRTDSRGAMAAFWLLLGGTGLWLMSAVLFYCRQLRQQEAMELEDIAARESATKTIFESEAQNLRPAADRLAWMLRWVVPIFTLLLAAYLATIGILVLRSIAGNPAWPLVPDGDARTQSWIVSVIVAFLGFMLSRYCTGLGSQESYRPLRAPGSYLLVNVLATLAVIASLIAANWANATVDTVVLYVLPCLQIVLAIELTLNLLLDLYRPRVPGQEQRLAYDSRLFDLIAEPGRVGHSIADTLNYQFGFEVSKTWFYQVLSRAMIPMMVVGVLIVVGMTSFVIIPHGQKGVIFHCGKIVRRQVEPGQYLTWPWPIDRVERFNVQEVHDIYLGAGKERPPNIVNGRELILWSEDHGQREEKDFLVAVPPSKNAKVGKEVPSGVNIIKLVVLVQYRISDVVNYGFKYDDPVKQLEMLANREMVRCLASATLTEQMDSSDRPQAVMSFGRQAAADELKRRIKTAVEKDLGVEIVNVAIQAIHPSQEGAGDASRGGKAESVAGAYEKAMAAQQEMEAKRHAAQGKANAILAQAAGSPGLALKLALAIRKQRELESLAIAPAPELDARIDSILVWVRKELRSLQELIDTDQLMGRVSVSLAAASRPAATTRDSTAGLGRGVRDRLEMRDLYLAYISELQQIRERKRGALLAVQDRTNREVKELFDMASGQPVALEAEAQSQRWNIEMAGRASAENFQRELAAYKNAPQVYMLDRYLEIYDQVLPGLTKYILGVDRNKIDLRVDLRSEAQPLEPTGGEKFQAGPGNQGN